MRQEKRGRKGTGQQEPALEGKLQGKKPAPYLKIFGQKRGNESSEQRGQALSHQRRGHGKRKVFISGRGSPQRESGGPAARNRFLLGGKSCNGRCRANTVQAGEAGGG